MLDHTLDERLLGHLKAVASLATLNGYTGQDNADHKLPALTVSTTSEPLAGSDTAFRGEVGVSIESEAHDTMPETQGERVEVVRAILANRAQIIAGLNATGRLHIYSYAPLGTEPTAGEARFATKLRYRFGFGSA